MKKIVLCAIHAKYIHTSPALWYLKKALEDYNAESVIKEWTINGEENDFLNKIIDECPDIVGFSCYIWNIKYVLSLGMDIRKKLPNVKIILGGPEVSYVPEIVMRENNWIDYIISGEGEEPLSALIDCIVNNKAVEEKLVPGLSYRAGEKIKTFPPINMTCWPDIDFEGYSGSIGNRIAYIESSRGCPFSCAFCLSGRNESVKYSKLEDTFRQIEELSKKGIKTIKFVDRTFNCNKKRANEIFSYLIDGYGVLFEKDIRFHFEVGADLFDEETLELLKKVPVGLFQFEAGIQSFNEKTLYEVNRKTDLDRLALNVSSIIKFGNIHVHVDLIAGLPYETMDIFKNSFNCAFKLRPHMLQLGFLKMLHGSELRKNSKKYGYIFDENPPYEFYENYWIKAENTEKIHMAEDALERMYNSHRFLETIEFILKATGETPYDFFEGVGEAFLESKLGSRCTLDNYTDFLYGYLSQNKAVDKMQLRDVMTFDRLATINTGKLPKSLRVYDDDLKGLSQKYRLIYGEKSAANLVYFGGKRAIYAVYEHKHQIFNRYPVFFDDLE